MEELPFTVTGYGCIKLHVHTEMTASHSKVDLTSLMKVKESPQNS